MPQASVFSAPPHHLCLSLQAYLHLHHSIIAAIRVGKRIGKHAHAQFCHHDYEGNETLQCGSKVKSRNETEKVGLVFQRAMAHATRACSVSVPTPGKGRTPADPLSPAAASVPDRQLIRIQIPSVSHRHDPISLIVVLLE